MGRILLRNLDDEVIERLKIKAEFSRKSLEQVAREALVAAAPLTPEERAAISDHIRSMQKGVLPAITLDEIHEDIE